MDESVIRAMGKWPDVPAVYGWLSLSRRGDWLIKNERITHRAARAFISRNYEKDEQGCWFFQNGPQRVYVSLEYTPWVVACDARGELVTHTGQDIVAPEGAWLDDAGNLLLMTKAGVAVLDDRDLETVSAGLRYADGRRDESLLEQAIADTQSGRAGSLRLVWKGRTLEVTSVKREEAANRFGFCPDPNPPTVDSGDHVQKV